MAFDPTEASFPAGELTVRAVRFEELEALQSLLERCADYYQLAEGAAAGPNAALHLSQELPPGASLEQKWLFGIFDRAGRLIGVLEGLLDFPAKSEWYLGLLLLEPSARSGGQGRAVVEALLVIARSAGATLIRAAVLEENQAALRFWRARGFEEEAVVSGYTLGQKQHQVRRLRLPLY